MNKEKIANRQLFYILYMMRTTVIIALLPVLTSADAAQDAWLAAFLSFFGTALIAFLIVGLGTRFPEQTIVQYGQKLLGTWLGKIPILVILWTLLSIAATDLRIFAEMLTTSFLTDTPLAFLIGAMALLVGLGAREGIEVLARIADIVFPLFIAIIAFSILMPLPEFQSYNLEPVLARGLEPVLQATITPVIIGVQLLIMTILIPNLTAPRLAFRTTLWAMACASVTLVLAVLVTVGVLGPAIGVRSIFPFYTMTRAIEISEYLQRVEAPVIFAWGLGIFLGVSVTLYAGAKGLSQLLNLTDYRPLVLPMAAILGAYSFHVYEDIFQILAYLSPAIALPLQILRFLLTFFPLWLCYLYRLLRTN